MGRKENKTEHQQETTCLLESLQMECAAIVDRKQRELEI